MKPTEKIDLEVQVQIAELDAAIEQKIGDSCTDDEVKADFLDMPEVPNDIWVDEPMIEPEEPEGTVPEADEWTPEAYDQYVGAEVLMERGGTIQSGIVKQRRKNDDKHPTGKRNNNPLLDTREYEVVFPDQSMDVLTANVIAESMYANVDDEGQTFCMLDEIIEHHEDQAVAVQPDEAYYSGTQKRKKTTKGWKLLVLWKDGSQAWLPLKDLKNSYPIQVAEYAVANKIALVPAFAWWVPLFYEEGTAPL